MRNIIKCLPQASTEKGFEYEVITQKGNKKYLETSVSPIKNSERKIIGFRGIVRDRTEQRQAEAQREATMEALRISEERYRNILESIQEGYFEVDLAGNFTFFNEALCSLYGYSENELKGMNYRQYTDQENAKNCFRFSIEFIPPANRLKNYRGNPSGKTQPRNTWKLLSL